MLDYAEYERLFNEGDDITHTETFFADDILFVGSSIEIKGKPDLYKFLNFAHNGVMERMRPQRVVNQGNFIFADIDMDFHATKERPEFPFGHMRPGDCVTVKFFVTYQVENDKVVALKAMTWAPEKGVAKLPKLGAHPSQRAACLAYLAAFSNADLERFSAFYQPDGVLELSSAIPALRGRQGITDFYGRIFKFVREEVAVTTLACSDDSIDLQGLATFTAIADAPDFPVAPLAKGEVLQLPVAVHYDLTDGLIQRAHVTRLGQPERVPSSTL